MFDQNDNHLSPQEISMSAEALLEKRFDQLPPHIKNHLQYCKQCSSEVNLITDIAFPEYSSAENTNQEWDFYTIALPLLAAAVILGFIFFVIAPTYNQNNNDDRDSLAELYFEEAENETSHVVDEIITIGPERVADDEPSLDRAEKTETSSEPKTENTLLASFTPDEELEMLVRNFQSAYRGNQVTVQTESTIVFPGQTSLHWNNPDEISLIIEIFNNEGKEIFSFSTTGSSVDIPKIEPGIFYWKLIEEDDFDLLFVGKIISQP